MRILFVLAAVMVTVGSASAQPTAKIAVEGGASHWMDSSLDECDECTPLLREFGGEVAFFATDSLAVLASVRLGFLSIDVTADDIRLQLDGRQLAVGTGLRYYGPPGRARFYGEVAVGLSRWSSTLSLFELRESASPRWRHVAPRAGVDIAVNDRTAVRIAGGWDIALTENLTLHSARAGAGLVFNVGRQ